MALGSGVLLGLSAGLSPGPMLALVLAQTLRHGSREGCKIALTPLVTDAPIIVVALALASKTCGTASAARHCLHRRGCLRPVLWRGRASSWCARSRSGATGTTQIVVQRESFTNLLNPHPWMFWLTGGRSDPGEGTGAELAGRCRLSVRVLSVAGGIEGGGRAAGRTVPRPAGRAALPGGDARPGGPAGDLCAPTLPKRIEKSGDNLTVPNGLCEPGGPQSSP